MAKAIYPGSFDPITNGHIDIIERAAKMFDKVIVGVLINSAKDPLFTPSERVDMIKGVVGHLPNIEVLEFDGLLVDFAREQNCNILVRGLRVITDFEYELQIGYANAALWAEFETVYLMPTLKNAFISSSIVRGIFGHGGDVTHLVPPQVTQFLREKYEYKF